ncbi:hypothetical protein CE91St46_23270 [Eubacteriales bacterium]|nr:DUF1624 domain-containing protein [Faecalicatena sp. BF-R-105]GKH51216.1 hypothetical protein CE91St46_23270 [Eubacteriales bacterium]GKH63934.1 hypothetical protein CE91St47_24030 [Eubacteriales bacterium]SFJ51925.1 Uncharacterized membrane protein [Ruminococcaceae bacterium D5]
MRYFTLDALRGFALINMVAYHFCYDLRYLYGLPLRFMDERSGFCWQQMICWTFILVSGASAALSRRPARRGMAVLGCGMLLTVVTFLIMPGQRIVFGVLHLLGCAMLLTAGLLPLLQRLSPAAGAAGSFLLFLGTRWISSGLLFGVRIFEPGMVSTNLFAPLGIYGPGFFSADYFPVIPWYFLFLTGYFLFGVLRAGGAGGLLSRKIPLLSAAGRHTLPVYLIHQPILMGICLLIFGEI